jgi:signal peptidase I
VTVLVAVAGLVLALAGAGLVWLRRRYVVIDIVGDSMKPSYPSGGRVLVKRTPPATVARGQVVVFEHFYGDAKAHARGDGEHDRDPDLPAASHSRPGVAPRGSSLFGHLDPYRSWLLKRVVAVPGDPLPRDHIPALRDTPESLVPQGYLIVLGDNPPASLDSRHFGYLPRDRLLGVVVRHLENSAGSLTPS